MQQKNISDSLKEKHIIVCTHVYGTGASQDLCRYFVKHKTKRVLYIGHPLFYDTHIKGSGFDLYEFGQKIQGYHSVNRKIPLFVGYLFDMIKTIIWSYKKGYTWDLYVGSNNLNAFTGLLLKKFGRVKKVVYYVIDYNPNRYTSSLINALYQRLDQYCVYYADETWNLSPRMEVGRKTFFHFTGGNQYVVPVGIWSDHVAKIPFRLIDKHTLVFLGHILKKSGIQHVITAIPIIRKYIQDFQFLVIGGGEYLVAVKKQVKTLKIEKNVRFTGFIVGHRVIERMLAKCALGIALFEKYDGKQRNFTYFSEATKIKSYFAAGLPVLLSDVPYNAREIERFGCGKIISYNPQSISKAVCIMMKDPNTLIRYRKKVKIYRKKFDWEIIFTNNLKRLV